MFSKVYSADLDGIEARVIQIEADISDGLPIFNMVGYLSSAVKEARERVRIALKNSGIRFPVKRITVNLSPASLRKEGTTFDLPIAVSLLAAFGHISSEHLEEYLIVGELGLDGRILPIHGCLSIVDLAKSLGYKKCIVPLANEKEAAVIDGIIVYGVAHMSQVIDFFQGNLNLRPSAFDGNYSLPLYPYDMSEVRGQKGAKRALEIAVSGHHNILIMGPPGSGKTMLANRITSIMPPLSLKESIEVTKLYSAYGLLPDETGLIRERPFRAPHHTITDRALLGGGKKIYPGEVTLASSGVLFFDEFLEFRPGTLELLRQPLEDRFVNISRVHGGYQLPTDFMLVAATNPCKCGFYPNHDKCQCGEEDVRRYLSRVSKPVLDRIDLCTQTFLNHEKEEKEESSFQIRKRVKQAMKVQSDRFRREKITSNSAMTPVQIQKYCTLSKEAENLFRVINSCENLSYRGINRILKVARTIADLDLSSLIHEEHLSEAYRYKVFSKEFWNME